MRYDPVFGWLIGVPATLAATACYSQAPENKEFQVAFQAVASKPTESLLKLEPGSSAAQDKLIRTYRIGADGLRFDEHTTLTVYPNTSVKLDRFVYGADLTVSEIGLNLAKGAFRLASLDDGTSGKYKLKTPHATLGAKGTVVHVTADDLSTMAQALHGSFEGCSLSSGICKVVNASDLFNAVQFWIDGRVEVTRISDSMGEARSGSSGASDPAFSVVKKTHVGPPLPMMGLPEPNIHRYSGALNDPAFSGPRARAFGGSSNSVANSGGNYGGGGLGGAAPKANPGGAVCFVRGMLVLTPTGEKRIEDLRVGDEVITKSAGPRKIRWTPRQVFAREGGRAWGAEIAPIRFEAGSLGEGRPHRPLLVSPRHALLFDGVLVQAHLLVNGSTIRQVDYSGRVLEYFNLELDDHEVVFVNGVAVETYYPETEHAREQWSNFSDYARLYPERARRLFGPAMPVIDSPAHLSLSARARSLFSRAERTRDPVERVREEIGRRAAAG